MKKSIIVVVLLAIATTISFAQNASQARKVLDKTASIVGRKGGATANFTISGKYGNASGTIAIKGSKFRANTQDAIVWFDGKTEWTYIKKNEEVNVTTPTEAQQQAMNPYKFITIYKNGFNLSMTTSASEYKVHLIAQNQTRTIKELYITIDKRTNLPKQIKMRQSNGWTTINISNFKAENQSDAHFRFNSKDFPKAEVIDLR
ncbi:MAG: LolA-like putative outer membrane lipoprotein chaperone [Prevotella sp.]|uniref:LolA-like putative outer membrane lipoprotein chaperone n=1 Tax=Prevotella sp. TaxID=59823 RepID=UPI002A257BE4|nr:LolA-like putative outer membrane lipoprotein chaperone [Prevotella sp.]MDD7318191.1 LolA-like putative outer membrane lipoprotein chaperone [Prevotellaceae bacterium]MDY4020920.1 LolA-like putative outer membrane lipoprotein chaperone [Prevotella sp.]